MMFISDILFANRKDAGEQLALRLEKYKNQDALVLGIPRGGVEVGYYIARNLNAELSVIVSKKITYPGHPEYAVGAVCEEGVLFIDEKWNSSEGWLISATEDAEKEIEQRLKKYRDNKPLPDMKGRVVILVDDGIATGSTLVSAIMLCKKHEPEKIVVAAPVAGDTFEEKINEADELVIIHRPEYFFGVGNSYEDFSQLTDEDVLFFLNKK
jgi:putative phosphoribosyl transferase